MHRVRLASTEAKPWVCSGLALDGDGVGSAPPVTCHRCVAALLLVVVFVLLSVAPNGLAIVVYTCSKAANRLPAVVCMCDP
jgi:hypothetical protein